MPPDGKHRTRKYDAPRRAAGAARTRSAIVVAAARLFEERGWSGTTISEIAVRASVARQTVEAIFGTKAALLEAVVDYAVRGDTRGVSMPERPEVKAMEQVSESSTFLDLHARHLRSINERSARVASAVETAALSSTPAARLWRRMTDNRRFAAAWAASTLLAKADAPPDLGRRDAEETFWVAIDWSTYRSLTAGRGLSPRGFETWLRRYYRRMLGA